MIRPPDSRERHGTKRSPSQRWVGIDLGRERVHIAVLESGPKPIERVIERDAGALRALLEALHAEGGSFACAYEAGSDGDWAHEVLSAAGVPFMAGAPSRFPPKPGSVKTDRRDALRLAELLRAGQLTPVVSPSARERRARALCRARLEVASALARARQRLNTLEGLFPREPLSPRGVDPRLLDLRRAQVSELEHHKANLQDLVDEIAEKPPFARRVAALRCLHGIGTLTALTLLTELHGFVRFTRPQSLMAYLGLVPRVRGTGGKYRRAGITKAGNKRVRRLLVECAWHFRHPPRTPPSAELSRRRRGHPAELIALADKAHRRLHDRYVHLTEHRKKAKPEAVVAVARELVGFVWAILRLPHLQSEALEARQPSPDPRNSKRKKALPQMAAFRSRA